MQKLVKNTLPLTTCLHNTSDVQSRDFVVEPDENNFIFFLVILKASDLVLLDKSTCVKPPSKWCTLECRGKTLQRQDSQWLVELKSYMIR